MAKRSFKSKFPNQLINQSRTPEIIFTTDHEAFRNLSFHKKIYIYMSGTQFAFFVARRGYENSINYPNPNKHTHRKETETDMMIQFLILWNLQMNFQKKKRISEWTKKVDSKFSFFKGKIKDIGHKFFSLSFFLFGIVKLKQRRHPSATKDDNF